MNEWQAADYPTDPFTSGITVTAWSAPQGVFPNFPSNIAIQYQFQAGVLIFSGVMAPADLATLLGISFTGGTVNPNVYGTAIKTLYVQSQCPPIIDPDVIGPDDFRAPFPKSQPSDPDKLFDVWVRRRNWVDAMLAKLQQAYPAQTGTVQNIFAAMQQPWIYAGGTVTTPLRRGPAPRRCPFPPSRPCGRTSRRG